MAVIEAVVKSRRGTATAWASANPTLAAGERGYETDTGREKVGNGSTPWNSIGYSDSSSKISDATAIGKAILTAVDAPAVRSLLSITSVENTSDINKPVSTATQAALDANLVTATGRAVAFAIAL